MSLALGYTTQHILLIVHLFLWRKLTVMAYVYIEPSNSCRPTHIDVVALFSASRARNTQYSYNLTQSTRPRSLDSRESDPLQVSSSWLCCGEGGVRSRVLSYRSPILLFCYYLVLPIIIL